MSNDFNQKDTDKVFTIEETIDFLYWAFDAYRFEAFVFDDDRDGIKRVINEYLKSNCDTNHMNCPSCNWQPPEFEGEYYQVNENKYPIIKNERRYYNGSFDMHDWEETHFCPNCKKEFDILINGV